MIANWVCGDYTEEEKAEWGQVELDIWVEERNKELAHIRQIGHCEKCGHPR
jgi:predicted nucleotidyltransferase